MSNEGFSQIKINRIDNTNPTITSLSKTLIENNHKAKITLVGHDRHSTLGEGSGTTGIAITKTNVTPSLSEFRDGTSVEVDNNGVYYIWSKDLVGNISSSAAITVNEIVMDVTGTRNWNDTNNKYTSRKDTVLSLYRSTEANSTEVKVAETILRAGDQTFNLGKHLRTDSQGNTYKYRIEEAHVPGYETTYDVRYKDVYPYGVESVIANDLKLPTYNANIVSRAIGVVNNEYLKNGRVEVKGVITASSGNKELEGLHGGRVTLTIDNKITIDESKIVVKYKKAETGEETEITEYQIVGNEIRVNFGEGGVSEKGDSIEVVVEGTVTMIDSILSEVKVEGYLRDYLGENTDVNLGVVTKSEARFDVIDHSVVELEVLDKETKERIKDVTVLVREKESRNIVREVFIGDEIAVIEDLEVGDYILELATLNYDKGYVKPAEIELRVEDNSYQKVIMEQDYTKIDVDVSYLGTNGIVEGITLKLVNENNELAVEKSLAGSETSYYFERIPIGKYKVVIEGLQSKDKYEIVEIEIEDVNFLQEYDVKVEILIYVTGTRIWNDIDNTYQTRRDTTLKLYRNTEINVEEELVSEIELKTGDETFTFGQQLRNDSKGNVYKYRVEEAHVPGYETTYEVTREEGEPYGVEAYITNDLKLPTYNASIVSKATGIVNNEYLKNGRVEIKGKVEASETNKELEGLHEGTVILGVDSKITIDESKIKITYKKAETEEEIDITEYEVIGNEIHAKFGENGVSEKGDSIEIFVEGTVTKIDSILSEIKVAGYLRDYLGENTDVDLGEVAKDELSFEVSDHSVVELEVLDKETKERIENVKVLVREKESRNIVREVIIGNEIGVIEDLEIGDYILELETLNYDKGYVKPEEIELKVEDNSYQKIIMEQDYTKIDINVKYLETNEIVEGLTLKVIDENNKVVAERKLEKGETSYSFIRIPIGKYKIALEGIEDKYKYEEIEIEIKDANELQKYDVKIEEKVFKLKIDKYISKVILTKNESTVVTETNQTGEEETKEIVKVDIRRQEFEKAEVYIYYVIRVKNIGEVSGYAEQIVEKLPKELIYEKEMNETGIWQVTENNELINESIKDVEIDPGESREFILKLKWENNRENIGEIKNEVELTKTRNDLEVKDRTEKVSDNAEVLISVATGEHVIYITVTFTSLSMLLIGVILIKKYVLTI